MVLGPIRTQHYGAVTHVSLSVCVFDRTLHLVFVWSQALSHVGATRVSLSHYFCSLSQTGLLPREEQPLMSVNRKANRFHTIKWMSISICRILRK